MIKSKRLSRYEITKLSQLSCIPEASIQYLYQTNILDAVEIRNVLIEEDCRRLKEQRNPSLTVNEIIQTLAKWYNVSKSRVETTMYNKNRNLRYCSECNAQISKVDYDKNNRLCDRCIDKLRRTHE